MSSFIFFRYLCPLLLYLVIFHHCFLPLNPYYFWIFWILIFSFSSISRFFITFDPPYLPGIREERRGNTRFTHGGFDFPGFQDHPRKPHEHSYRKESSKGGVCFTVVEKGGRYHRMVILSPRLRDR